MTKRQVLLLFGVILLCYVPILFGEMAVVDDAGLLKRAQAAVEGKGLHGLFGQSAAGLYFRPMVRINAYLDSLLIGYRPFWLHLETVLMHSINALLVALMTVRLFRIYKPSLPSKTTGLLILGAGLLFGLHPLTAESTSWYSGRSDIMACAGVLGSALLVLDYRLKGGIWRLLLSLIFLFVGTMAKEPALAFTVGWCLLLMAPIPQQGGSNQNRRSWWLVGLILLGSILPFAAFLGWRSSLVTGVHGNIGKTLVFMDEQPLYCLMLWARAIGFYAKKLFLPWPLNFAIIDVDPLYDLFAIPVLILLFYLLFRRTLLSWMALSGVILAAPALLIVLGKIAWTPFAERYLYMPLALVVPALICGLAIRLKPEHLKRLSVGLAVVLAVFGATTSHRAYLWGDGLRFLKDMTEKSPQFRTGQMMYGARLWESGDIAASAEAFRKAKRIPAIGYNPEPDVYLAMVDYVQGRKQEGLNGLRFAVHRSTYRKPLAFQLLRGILRQFPEDTELKFHIRQIVEEDPNPLPNTNAENYYRYANLWLRLGEREKAMDLYRKAIQYRGKTHWEKKMSRLAKRKLRRLERAGR